MKAVHRMRAGLIRALRWAPAALATSRLGRRALRGMLNLLGSRAVYLLHDDLLAWLVERPLHGRREGLARRLRAAAGGLAYRPGIFGSPSAAVTLVVVWGLPAQGLAEIVDRFADRRSASAGAALFLTDCDDFHAFRSRGLAFEHVPARAEWTRHHGSAGWSAFLTTRLSGILATWGPDRIVVVRDDNAAALRDDGVWEALALTASASRRPASADGTEAGTRPPTVRR